MIDSAHAHDGDSHRNSHYIRSLDEATERALGPPTYEKDSLARETAGRFDLSALAAGSTKHQHVSIQLDQTPNIRDLLDETPPGGHVGDLFDDPVPVVRAPSRQTTQMNTQSAQMNTLTGMQTDVQKDKPASKSASKLKRTVSGLITGSAGKTQRITFEQYCSARRVWEPQPQQKLLPVLISPTSATTGMLLIHKIGSGKTCTAIRIAERWKGIRDIIFVAPASLLDNFRDELRSDCARGYITADERRAISSGTEDERRTAYDASNARIDAVYKIMSYNKFVKNPPSLRKAIIIIDEVQNIVSDGGSWYLAFKQAIEEAPDSLRVVLMSATPMFDNPAEIALCLNLLRPRKRLPTGREFWETFVTSDDVPAMKNKALFASLTSGLISYYAGAPSYVFPETTIKYVRCPMSKFQLESYDLVMAKHRTREDFSLLALANNFMIGPRIVSNIAFPNARINAAGAESFTGAKATTQLARFSCKFDWILRKLARVTGTVFIYSNFKGYGGLKSLAIAMRAAGWTEFTGAGGSHQFAIYSGDTPREDRARIRRVFSQPENTGGRLLKVVMGSPSIKEGISFKNCRTVIVLDLHWNWSRLLQVIGRASRHCSHKDLPPEQRTVRVYILLAVGPSDAIDPAIVEIMEKKNRLIQQFEQVCITGAVDRGKY